MTYIFFCPSAENGSAAPRAMRRRRRGFMASTRVSLDLVVDDLIGYLEDGVRHVDAQRAGRSQIQDQLELCRLLNRQVARLCSLQYPVHVIGGATEVRE